MTAGNEAGGTAESGEKAKTAAADEARVERLRKRARTAGGDEARAVEGDGGHADKGEEEEPRYWSDGPSGGTSCLSVCGRETGENLGECD